MGRFMDRFRFFPLFVLLALLVLSACTLFSPVVLPVQSNPTNDFVSTIVAQTLTAFPSPTLPPSLTASFTQTSILVPQMPEEFIFFYFDAINSRNYSLTWSLLTDRFKNNMSGSSQDKFQGYAGFWNTVNRVTVKNVYNIRHGDLCAVDATLQLEYSNGQSSTNTYPYTLAYDHTRNTWMFDFIPTNTATATLTRTKTPTRTSTSTPTRTRTPTLSRTPTRTVSPPRTVSVTPSQTRSSTPTLTRTLTLTRTATGTITYTRTPSFTPTVTMTPTITLTGSPTFTPTTTATATDTGIPSATPTATMTPTFTPSETASPSPSSTPSETPTPTSGS